MFSSTAAVYGELKENPVPETAPTNPINPYGISKLMSEWIIQDYAKVSNLRYVIFRYFNVAGADPDGQIGQYTQNATHLIKAACDAALGRKPIMKILGTDFDTPDGTGVRDFIHVADLAQAHLDGLRYLGEGGDSEVLNCGYGQGYSVREVIESLLEISKKQFTIVETSRRQGDPGCVISQADKIRQVLNWFPKHAHLHSIIGTAWEWENHHQRASEKRVKSISL